MTTDVGGVREWDVLLLGGSSGTGKSTVAPLLARRLGAACAQVDDFRLVMQRITAPQERPALHFFTSNMGIWSLPPDLLCERLVEVGQIVSSALEIVVAHHVATAAPIVLEGDGIMPALAAQRIIAGVDVGMRVRAVFLHEDSGEAIRAIMEARGRGFHRNTEGEQQTQARMNLLYGQWLRREAERYNLPVLPARPWETLPDRILSATGS